MQPAKRIEIIVNSLEVDRVLAILDKADVPGYTAIKNAYGKGKHGIANDDLGELFSNIYIITVCHDDEQLDRVVSNITPLLQKVGGLCLVSDTNLVMP